MQAPALTEACATWQRCAARDPTVVGRARVTAETFAEILNGFVDAVSWKTMVGRFSYAALFAAYLVDCCRSNQLDAVLLPRLGDKERADVCAKLLCAVLCTIRAAAGLGGRFACSPSATAARRR